MENILLTGGGTLGPVVPLLAVGQKLCGQGDDIQLYWLGTYKGPERKLISKYNIEYQPIASAKMRRYVSLYWLIDPFRFMKGIVQAWYYLRKWQVDIVLTAGGYVSVPVAMIAKLMKIPVLVHQQDVLPGIANKMMSGFASKITVALEENKKAFGGAETEVVGNPVRQEIAKIKEQSEELNNKLFEKYDLRRDLPILFVLGGGTGSDQINELIWGSLDELTKICQIIHITGKNKKISLPKKVNTDTMDSLVPETRSFAALFGRDNSNYHPFEFLDNTAEVYTVSDIVIARAGFSTLTELSHLGKPAIIIPISHSHQVANAKYFKDNEAIEMVEYSEKILGDEVKDFVGRVKSLIKNKDRQIELGKNIHKALMTDTGSKLAEVVREMLR